ncbi:MAG: hypothetical protein GC164_11775 [Phycisphaera sp.]|nr:hypothetical protein [Phycisphaera sp.]
MKIALVVSAGIALITLAVSVSALSGVHRLPVIEYLLWPGAMIAWMWGGDNYRDGKEFMFYTAAIGVPFNAVLSFIFGMAISWVALWLRGPWETKA